eukprot:133272-Pyramimonas_sp.AAC.1
MAPTDPNDWTYAKQRLAFLGADVGRIAIADTDGDGYNELFIPAYDLGMLVHYKFGSAHTYGSQFAFRVYLVGSPDSLHGLARVRSMPTRGRSVGVPCAES